MTPGDVVLIYADILKTAVPFMFVFWVCETIACTLLRAAFGGRLSFRLQ